VITPTKEQVRALDKIRSFLGSNDNIFTLAGYAGTGKTTIMRKAIEDYKGKVIVAAPTHKAKKKISNSTKKEGKTLHKLLGMSKKGDKWVVNEKKMTIQNYDLVVIDEASMINAEMYGHIKKYAKGKVIFLGDEGQLKPIGENESKVFSEARGGRNYVLLEEVQRVQGSNPLIDIYTAIRKNLKLRSGGYKREDMLSPTGEGIIFTNDDKFMMDRFREMFTSPEYIDNPDYVKVIAKRNKKVDSVNAAIRGMIYDDPDVIEEGETFVAEETIVVNNEEVLEKDVEYLVTSKTPTVKTGLKGWDVTIHVIDEGKNIMKTLFIVDHNDKASIQEYKTKYDFYQEKSKEGEFAAFASWKANHLVLRDYGVANRTINNSYAINTHKAQGSTYDHVFVIEDDITRLPEGAKETPDVIENINRMLYVAMSRPRKTATVFLGRKKKASEGNNFVTKPKLPEDQPGTTEAPPTQSGPSPFAKLDTVQPSRLGMKNSEDLKDSDMLGYSNLDVSDGYENIEPTGSLESERAITPPEEFVSDQEVEEFMKQCK
jgi:exodeoxyribonuclease-5